MTLSAVVGYLLHRVLSVPQHNNMDSVEDRNNNVLQLLGWIITQDVVVVLANVVAYSTSSP
jgi:hypothetical protein